MAFPPASHATLKMGHPWELCRGRMDQQVSLQCLREACVQDGACSCSSTSVWCLRAALFYAGPCYAMLCHAVPCHAMPCHAMPCHAMLCYATLCYAMLRYATLRYATLRYATLRYATLRYATLRYPMPCTWRSYAMHCHAVLSHHKMYSTILAQ